MDLLWITLCLLWIAEAHAAPAPPQAVMRLEIMRGPGAKGCPDETFLRTEVTRRLGYDPFRDDAPWALTVGLAWDGAELAASLALRDPKGETQWADGFGTRNGCEQLLSGVALAIAAQLLGAPERAPPPPAPAPPPTQARRDAPAPPRRAELPPARPRPEAAPAPAKPLRLEAGLGVTLGLGITPGAAAGMMLSLGVRRSDWSIAVEGRGLVALAQEVEAVPLGTRAFTAAALACHRGHYLFACGVVTGGVVRFVPQGPWDVVPPAQPLLGAGTRLGSRWPFSDRWSAYGYAEAVWFVADAVLRRRHDPSETPAALTWSSPPAGAAFGFGVTATY
ncbi:hypothetical protein WMF28_33510 [Sorangium sp. So ce590]|uniref:hypothetical protein n=1 Tax=Sorangium sp. So ce590 TaxID=3133317 RepID=UPI003F60607E